MVDCYHKPCDDVSQINSERLEFMAKVSDALFKTLDGYGERYTTTPGPTTPSPTTTEKNGAPVHTPIGKYFFSGRQKVNNFSY